MKRQKKGPGGWCKQPTRGKGQREQIHYSNIGMSLQQALLLRLERDIASTGGPRSPRLLGYCRAIREVLFEGGAA